MKTINNFSTSIHSMLKWLIEEKSQRDNKKFTGYQLAAALSMPRSIITKLTHNEESKRISNPKIETLIKIVDFFKNDGFDISIDDLLGLNKRYIDIQSQSISTNSNMNRIINLFSLDNANQKIGTIELSLDQSGHFLAYYLNTNIDPFFKSGTIFIIDSNKPLINDSLVAIKLDSDKVQIKKYNISKNKIILKSLENEKEIVIMPTTKVTILGVVIQINAKT